MKSTLLMAALTFSVSLSRAESAPRYVDENTASSKINQLLEPYNLNLDEKIVFAGHTAQGTLCAIEISKNKYHIHNFDGKSVNIKYISGDYTDSRTVMTSLDLFYKSTTENYLMTSQSAPQTQKIAIQENPNQLLIQVNIKKISSPGYDTNSTIQKSIEIINIDNGQLESVSAALTYKHSSFILNNIIHAANPYNSRKGSENETCLNLVVMGKRLVDYNHSVNFGDRTKLIEYCEVEYSPLCPNNISYTDLPKSLENKTFCSEYKEQLASGKITRKTARKEMIYCERNGNFENL